MKNSFIETITHGLEPIALISRADYDEPGIQFFTPGCFSQQVAYMKHPQGHKISAHVHNMMKRQGPLHAGSPRCPAGQGEGKALCFKQGIQRRPDSALRRSHSPLRRRPLLRNSGPNDGNPRR